MNDKTIFCIQQLLQLAQKQQRGHKLQSIKTVPLV